MKKIIAAVSWSGGKDSCFAYYKALQAGHKAKYLFNTISDDFHRVRFHGVDRGVIQKQADVLAIQLLQRETAADQYEVDYIESLRYLKRQNIDGLICGDIHLAHSLTWAKKVTRKAQLQLFEPLWSKKPEDIFQEFLAAGFEAVVVSTQASLLDAGWVGRKLDQTFLEDIKQHRNIDICGENGEYHTLVLNGPIFRQKINITASQKVFRSGYWFLDIQNYQLQQKN